MDNVNNWLSQPDVCRCCLSTSGSWDMTTSYITETGMKEVYLEMLQECYGLALSHLTEWGSSRLICGQCVSHLRDANSFKKQVAQAEILFTDYCARKDNVVNIKTEKEISGLYLLNNDDSIADDADVFSEGEKKTIDIENILDKTKKDKNVPAKRRKTNLKTKRKRRKIDVDNDIDSDTPIAALTRNNVALTDQNNLVNENQPTDLSDRISNACEVTKKRHKRKPKITAENYIDNRHLRANITLILTNSTVVPFKNINNTKFICLYCDNSYLLFTELKEHVKKQHSNMSKDYIQQCLKTPKDLIKADISVIKCTLCGESIDGIDKLVEHLTGTHRKPYHYTPRLKPAHGILGFDMSSDIFKCHLCNKQFRFFKNLSVHMNEHSDYFMCHVCGKRFVSEHRLQTHVATHRSVNVQCKHCHKNFKSLSARNYHVRKMHNDAKFKCTECSETFTQYQHRLRHLVEIHNFKKPEFKCDVCSKYYASSGGLRAHIRYSHLKSKEYPCEKCGKVFVYKWIWKRHLDIHLHCSKKFAKPYTLQIHLRIHLNDKRFVCSVCKVAFVQKCSLKNHVKVHHPDSSTDVIK